MRKIIPSLALTSIMMTLCIPASAQHEYVDLGLSVKWATCNVGAETPESYGDLYAWGMTVTSYETGYSWDSYIYCNGSDTSMTKYCKNSHYGYEGFTDDKTTLEPKDDVAHILWGGKWRIPTADEWRELLDSCTMSPRTKNGVWGALFTSKVLGYEGRSIFLPFAGSTFLSNPGGTQGNYWSSTLGIWYPWDEYDIYVDIDDYAYYLSIDFWGGKGVLNQMRMWSICPSRLSVTSPSIASYSLRIINLSENVISACF